MIPPVRWAGIASLAVLAVAPPCLAQPKGAEPGRGGIGGQIGASYFHADADYSNGARARFDFAGSFRYVVAPWFRMQVSPGFTWSAYTEDALAPFIDERFPEDGTNKKGYLTLLVPISAQLQLTTSRGNWIYHAGIGPGIYRVMVEHRRKVVKDPVTDELHRGLYPGFSGEIGFERFLKSLTTTSVEFVVVDHLVFAVRDQQFPSGWNSNLGALGARLGVNYYFDIDRRAPKQPAVPVPAAAP
jgi:hypothetical protein